MDVRENMLEIRPYRQSDKRRVQEICLRTADDDLPFTTIEEREFSDYLLSTYCDYYIECEPESCFVLVDEADEAVGYIMCAKEQASYRKIFLKEYRARIRCSRQARTGSFGEALLHGVFAAKYPAHLHIDILKGYRGSGNGSKMMAELMKHLKENKVKGVHLIVSESNSKAIRFYEHCGFKTLLKFGRGRAMGTEIK